MANLTEKMRNIWKEIKNQPKDVWFFYLFILTFTLGVRKVILYFPVKRTFNEYFGVYVYASDIFLYLTILVWITAILYNKISILSSSNNDVSRLIHRIKDADGVNDLATQKLSTGKFAYFKAFFKKLFHVEQFQSTIKNCSTPARRSLGVGGWNIFCNSSIFLIPLLLVTWSFLSICWSENQIISFYRSARFLELYLLFIYVAVRFVPYLVQCLHNCSTCLQDRQAWNNSGAGPSEIVPPTFAEATAGKRGTISDTFDGDDTKMFHVEHFDCILIKTAQYFRAISLGLVLIMLFDHYLWDIWQGQVLFWLVCGILAGVWFSKSSNLKNCSTWNNLSDYFSKIVPPSYAKAPAGKRGTITIDNESEESSSAVNNVPPTFAEATAGRRGTFNGAGMFFWVIIFVGVAQSLIGITQFILQHSIGLFWLKESIIGQNIAGVAKIIVNSEPLIRAYGLFPHPNILGGFLFFSIVITLLYLKCSTWNILKKKNEAIVPRGTILHKIILTVLAIQVLGILLSFSKSAIVAVVLALIYTNVPRGTFSSQRGTTENNGLDSKKSGEGDFVNCSTWNILESRGKRGTFAMCKFKKLFHVEQFKVLFGLGLVVLFGLFFLRVEFYALLVRSLSERWLYLSISERIIADNSIVGVGSGQFIFEAERLFPNLELWQYQPVHNVFLLIWSEWGIIGLVLFIVFLWKLFHVEHLCKKSLLQPGESACR